MATATATDPAAAPLLAFDAKHKKLLGRLTITPTCISWRCDAAAPVVVAFAAVAKHLVTPQGAPTPMLKLERSDGGGPVTFKLPAQGGATRAYDLLQQARNIITERLHVLRGGDGAGAAAAAAKNKAADAASAAPAAASAASAASASGGRGKKRPRLGAGGAAVAAGFTAGGRGGGGREAELARREALLAGDPQLRDLHRAMVRESGAVTEDDFWAERQSLVDRETAAAVEKKRSDFVLAQDAIQQIHPQARKAMSSGDDDGGGGGGATYKVRLTAANIALIFKMYPTVRRAYDDKVPHELTERQFWTEYLRSVYFHESNRTVHVSKSDLAEAQAADFFSPYVAATEAAAGSAAAAAAGTVRRLDGVVNARNDISATAGGLLRSGAGGALFESTATLEPPQTSAAAKQRAETAATIAREQAGFAAAVLSGADRGEEADLAEMVMDMPAPTPAYAMLNIADKRAYGTAAVAVAPAAASGGPAAPVDWAEALRVPAEQSSAFARVSHTLASKTLQQLSRQSDTSGRAAAAAAAAAPGDEEFNAKLEMWFRRAAELLRHLHTAVGKGAGATPDQRTKAARLWPHIERLNDAVGRERERLLATATGARNAALLRPVIEQLGHALGDTREGFRRATTAGAG